MAEPRSRRRKDLGWLKNFLVGLLFCGWTVAALKISGWINGFIAVRLFKEEVQTTVGMTIFQAIIYIVAFLILDFLPLLLIKKVLVKAKSSAAEDLKDIFTPPDREHLGLTELPTWTDIFLAPVGIIIYYIIATVITVIFTQLFSWFDLEQSQDTGFSTYLFGTDRIIAFIALVVIAPIAEELIFRGWLYGKLRSRLSLVTAMLLTSILFGVMHGQWNVGV